MSDNFEVTVEDIEVSVSKLIPIINKANLQEAMPIINEIFMKLGMLKGFEDE